VERFGFVRLANAGSSPVQRVLGRPADR